MKAVVFHDIGDIRIDQVNDPDIKHPGDAIVRVTTTAICRTDLCYARGLAGTLNQGAILGHEAVGVVEAVGDHVRNFKVGERIILPATLSCGSCLQCIKGQYSQCDTLHSQTLAQGCQAEYVHVPFANNNLIKIPDEISDEKAILLADIFPAGFFAADHAKVQYGDTVVVLGCGPVGQFAIASCKLMGAGRIFAIDHVASHLEQAALQGAEMINSTHNQALEELKEATKGSLANVVIDTLGDCACMRWVGKCGTVSLVGLASQDNANFPIGDAYHKNARIVTGTCPHRRYIPHLLQLAQSNSIDPTQIISSHKKVAALDAYKNFDMKSDSWSIITLDATSHTRSIARDQGVLGVEPNNA